MKVADNPHLDSDLRALVDQVMTFCDNEVRPNGDTWEQQGRVPREVLRKMGELGMFSLRVPKEYGGLGLGPIASCAFAEALGRSSTFAGFDVTVLVHTDMAGPHVIRSGNDEQHSRFLSGMLSGEVITATSIVREVATPAAGTQPVGYVLLSDEVRRGVALLQWEAAQPLSVEANAKFGSQNYPVVFEAEECQLYRQAPGSLM